MTQKSILSLIASLAISLCCISAPRSVLQKQEAVEVPFTVESGIVIFQVRINGDGPFNLGLNTGRSRSVFSYETARTMNLKLFSNPGFVTDLADAPKLTILSTVEIGKLKLGNIQIDLGENFLPRSSQPVHGILGGDFLKDRTVQIDYPNRLIRFYSASPFLKDQPPDDSGRVVKLAMRFEAKLGVPIIDEAYINGKKIRAILDSGFSGTLSVTPAAVKYLDLEAQVAAMEPATSVRNNKLEPRKGQVKVLRIGPMEVASPTTLFYGKGSGMDQKLELFGAVVGNSFLRNYRVTFDYRNKMVVFERD